MSTFSVAGWVRPARSSIPSAVAASPEANSESFIWTWPAMLPTSIAATAKTSQPKSARFQCSALQRPARPARFSAPMALLPPPSVVVESMAPGGARQSVKSRIRAAGCRDLRLGPPDA